MTSAAVRAKRSFAKPVLIGCACLLGWAALYVAVAPKLRIDDQGEITLEVGPVTLDAGLNSR